MPSSYAHYRFGKQVFFAYTILQQTLQKNAGLFCIFGVE